ncbi:mersacidin/lichenicidin family type 2 lantibiotic [Nostoc sp. XA010]|uniref:mersacidin/lichenicidin family type 2 lantibiotic n=1 Tax=Nostoc sp. XA010 TaxID=2780407 RepID=UPI001E36E65F|nr:mersacidin/lichenicidin family type 2 lantibiotic [Nostoc sp. XA010]MCC5661573.1 mersacidin/lichenicidin family type 2 lantibiotic [Nostoc sp. XA010]
MSHEDIDIVRAWKDEEYRNSLSEEQRAQLPENPAGTGELSDTDMENVAGGRIHTNAFLCIETVVVNAPCPGRGNEVV